MKIWIDQSLKREDIESFLNASFQKIATFAENHAIVIEDVGAYVKKDNYVLCFGAQRRKELELFVVLAQGAINGKENFENLISTSSPSPIEYEWKEIEDTEIRPQVNPQDFFNNFFEEEAIQ